MKTRRIAILFVFLLLTAPLIVIRKAPAETNSVYFGVEPVAIPSLTDANASAYGLETPPTPSPVGQNFTLEIHLIGATADNVLGGISGVEVHLYFGNILTYAIPTGYTDMTGVAGGVLTGPPSKLLYGISAGFYDASGNSISGPPYTGAVYYEVAAASTAVTGWNNADGIVAKITFQIIKQPQSSNGEATANLPLACDFTDLTDKNAAGVNHDTIQGMLTIDATSAAQITQYSLTVNAVGNGTVTQNPLNATYAINTNVTLTAVPGANWTFQGWSGDVTGILNPVNITMNGNKTATAEFTQPGVYYNLTVNVVGNGTVTQNPFNATYLGGTVVTLTAVPGFNWTFTGWTGDLVNSQNPANITMTANKNVTAKFTFGQQYYNLTVNIAFFTNYTSFVQSGRIVENASVTETPVTAPYLGGTTVTLTAVPGLNWTFWSWSGNVTGTQNQTSFTINANMNVTATFGLIWDLDHDSRVSLSDLNVLEQAWKSTPNSANWNPQCDLAGPKGIISLTDLVTLAYAYWWLSVQVSLASYTLTVNVAGNGTVTQNPPNTTYPSGTIVTLDAVADTYWSFSGWTGDVTGVQNPVNITMNGNKAVTATFTQPGQYYNLTVNVVGNGTVTQSPLNTTYASGTIVTLTAVPSAGWTFQGWNGDLTGTQNPASITVNGNKTVTATFVTGTFAGSIDLFTQKTPFSGKGPNQSSDAFQQQELVILYALVTFSGDPIANRIVAFQVNGPANSLQNITVTGTGMTNSSGIAEFSLRMPTAPANGQQTVFGEWHAVATVDVDQVQLSDSLTFEVGWIVSIKSIVTLNDKLVPQTSFARLDTVVFNLTLENIALTPRSATITVDAQDVTGNLIIHAELDNLNIPPGESYTQASSQIPETATLGEANVSATAYTAPPSSGGTPYSPSVYTTFNIVTAVYYTLTVNVVGNGSVTEIPSAVSYIRNTNVTLTAVPMANWTFQGWSGDATGVQNPVNVTMDRNKTVTATFTLISVGHDVAIKAISVSSSQVQAGEVMQIVVLATNLGDYSETFNVTVYYDSNLIQVIPIVSMSPRSSKTLTVEWNTTNINPGVYTMSANATIVEGDTNPGNNNFTDGQVTITSTPVPGQLIPYPVILILFLTGLAILGGVATLMLFAFYSVKRRKRKARRTPHYVIVSHPHI